MSEIKILPLVQGYTECDHSSCPARTMVEVDKNGHGLGFCGHHYHSLGMELAVNGFSVTADSRHTLTARETEVHA